MASAKKPKPTPKPKSASLAAKKSAAKPGKIKAAVAAVKALIAPAKPKAKKAAVPVVTSKPSPVAKLKAAVATKSKPESDTAGIAVGKKAPSFKLKDQSGKELSSAALAGAPYVLYFYPKDDTTGCTKEACGFRDSFRAFGSTKARVIGVSPDSEASHAKFAGKYGLPFTLLADSEKTLANAYGVWVKKLNYGREYMGISRSTFVVDAKGVVQQAWRNVKVDGHVTAVLDAVKAL